MIELLSNSITDFFYSNQIIEENEKEIILYGLQLIISSIIGIILIITIGTILSMTLETLTFLATFTVIRMYSGGYHANSYLKCNITMIMVFLIVVAAVSYTPKTLVLYISITLTTISTYIFLKYSPVDDENKRLSEQKMEINRRITIALLIAFYSISVVAYKMDVYNISYTIIITIFLVALLIILKVKGFVEEVTDKDVELIAQLETVLSGGIGGNGCIGK